MHLDELREYCLSKKEVSEGFPFDESTLVFKVMNKIFVITSLDEEHFKANLKCDPEYAIELREQYAEVQPGFHMNKKHWNTVDFEGELDDNQIKEMIDHSYKMVVKGLKKSDREYLENL